MVEPVWISPDERERGLAVLSVMLREPDACWYASDLAAAVGAASGTLYPVLSKLRNVGWIDRCWETSETTPAPAGRPRRLYFLSNIDDVRRALDDALIEGHAAERRTARRERAGRVRRPHTATFAEH